MAQGFEQNDMGGSLFRNDKRNNDRQPTHRGSAKIDGIDYWVSAWVKETRNGDKFFSMAYTRKDENQGPKSGSANPAPQGIGDFDDDIPF